MPAAPADSDAYCTGSLSNLGLTVSTFHARHGWWIISFKLQKTRRLRLETCVKDCQPCLLGHKRIPMWDLA